MGQVSYLLVASKPLNRKTPYPRTARFRFGRLSFLCIARFWAAEGQGLATRGDRRHQTGPWRPLGVLGPPDGRLHASRRVGHHQRSPELQPLVGAPPHPQAGPTPPWRWRNGCPGWRGAATTPKLGGWIPFYVPSRAPKALAPTGVAACARVSAILHSPVRTGTVPAFHCNR